MNTNQKKQLDRYSMMIVSKYFKTNWDFIKMIQICKKYQEIPAMFHYNPVKLMTKTNLFPNIETYHIYDTKEKRKDCYEKYIYWYTVNYDTYLKKNENEEFKKVSFTEKNWNKYNSFKGANILGKCSLSQCYFSEIDLTKIISIERCCFKWNRYVKHIKLDKRIKTIPDDCFSGCVSLLELDLSSVKKFGNNCFNGCTSLTALTLPEILFKIGKNCFNELDDLEKIEKKGKKIIKTNMNYSLYKSFKTNGIDVKGIISYINYDRNKYGNEVPEVVQTIQMNCFKGVTTLGDVILPKSVTKLDYDCYCHCPIKSIDLSNIVENRCYFEECNELTSITINKRIIEASENNRHLFYNRLTALKNIELSDTNHIPNVSNHLRKLMNEKGYKYDKCIYTKQDRIETNSIVPEEVNIIAELVFCENTIKVITIPSNVTHIFPNNINSMDNLESIEIQSTNIDCGDNCFHGLLKIKELDLRGIISFGYNWFVNCPSLTKLIIQNIPLGNGLTNCDSLKEIEIIGIENNEYEHPIDYKHAQLLENKGIHCKRKVFYKYNAINNEETYCIPDGVNEIAPYSFQCCRLKEITIPSSVTLIQSGTFAWCTELTHLIIEGKPEIERFFFCGCYRLIQSQPELKQYS